MEIVWPDGTIQTIEGVSVDRTIVVKNTIEGPPVITDIWATSATPHEGERINLSISCISYPPSIIRTFRWDIDGDDDFDMVTSEPWVHFQVHNGGPARAKCRATDNFLVSDEMWLDYEVVNDPPTIDLPDMSVEMDSEFSLPMDAIFDSPSDMVNVTWSIDWGDGASVNGTGKDWMGAAHVYTEPGTSHVKLTCSDEDGPVEGWSEVTVLNVLPHGWIEPLKGNGTVFREDEEIAFKVYAFDTASDPGPYDISWEWGDGSSDPYVEATRVVHAYSSQGTFSVTARVKDSFGGVGSIAANVTIDNDPPVISVKGPGIIQSEEDRKIDLGQYVEFSDTQSDIPGLVFTWEFGDGERIAFASSPDAFHSYARSGDYKAVCTAIDGDGESSNASLSIRVNDVAPAILSVTAPLDVKEDEAFTIAVEASDTPSDLPTLSCALELGDGRIVEGFLADVSYPVSGTYTITVTVTDDDGAQDVSSAEVYVRNVAPSASIEVASGQLFEDHPVVFRAVDLYDTPSDVPKLNVSWDLGQGIKGYGEEVSRAYGASGSYKVRMTLTDGDLSESYAKTVTVLNMPPAAVATADRTEVEAGWTVRFTANLSTDTPTDLALLRYEWEIEGQKIPGSTVEWTFDTPGEFTVRLTVTDPEGTSSTDEIEIVVTPVEVYVNDNGSVFIVIMIAAALVLLIIFVLVFILIVKRRSSPQPVPPAPIPAPVQFPPPQAPVVPLVHAAIPTGDAIPHPPQTAQQVPPQVPIQSTISGASVPPPPAPPVAPVVQTGFKQ
jgi:PKD repeat protein